MENKRIPENMIIRFINGIRKPKAKQRLNTFQPETSCTTSRISGVNPADIQFLMV